MKNNDTKSVESSLSEEKTPAQIAYEADCEYNGWTPNWNSLVEGGYGQTYWKTVTDAVRAPLLAEIERLKRFARKCDWCEKPATEIEDTELGRVFYCDQCWKNRQKQLKDCTNVTPHNS